MWTKERLDSNISQKIEENKHLEYKSAGAIGKSEEKRKEISKDVSSFANSDGGILIYGIKEFDDTLKKHLPEKIDPVNRLEFSKEWLENVISGNISPIIDKMEITPITIDEENNLVVYIISIEKSNTAHQANDNRYYKRHNFKAIPMEDWEVKDVINRGNKPKIDISLYANKIFDKLNESSPPKCELLVVLKNSGNIGVQHIECFLEMDLEMRSFIIKPRPVANKKLQVFLSNKKENKVKLGESEAVISIYYQPLLPEVWREIGRVDVRQTLFQKDIMIKCLVSTEYGMSQKQFKLKDIIREIK